MTSSNSTSSNGQYTIYDDTDPRLEFSISPPWDTGIWPQQDPQPYNYSNHGSDNPGAKVTLVFNGTGVSVYGLKSGNHGYRDITLDGRDPIRCDGRTGAQGSQKLVYWVDGLSPGIHKIALENTGNQGQFLNIDYFNVTTATQTNNNSPSSPLGIIVGVVVAAAVLSLLAAAWFLWSRRRKTRQRQPGYVSSGKHDKSKGGILSPIEATAELPPEAHTVQPFYYPHGVSQSEVPSPPWTPPTNNPQYYPVPTSEPATSPPTTILHYPLVPISEPVTTPSASVLQYPLVPTSERVASIVPSTVDPFTSQTRVSPWTSSAANETTRESSQQATRYLADSKTRFSGIEAPAGSSSSSHPAPRAIPLSPIVDDSAPPPKYEV